jgi:ribosomal protein L29
VSEAPKSGRSYPEILKLNKDLVANLEGLMADHEARKKELEELKYTHDQAQGELLRLREELANAQARDGDRLEQLRRLEQERVDQLTAMSAHLNALRAAVDRYLHEGRNKAA